MKILVTGATGFTGWHLTKRLLDEGHQVVGVDNQPGTRFDQLKEKGAQLHIGSVTDQVLMDRVTEGCTYVFHLAAAFRKVNLADKVYWDINVNGTRTALEAARRQGVERFLYCSTCGVHGNVKQMPADEQSPVAPADWYQETKWQGERVCQEFLDQGMWVTIVRPTAIYGPGDPQRFVMLYKRAAKGRFLMIGDGRTHYHTVYVDNLIDAMLKAIATDAARGRTYLIGDERSIAISDLVEEIGNALGTQIRFIRIPYWPVYWLARTCELAYKPLPADPPLFRRRVDWFIQNRSFDISAAKRELAYKPAVDLKTGLARTGEWYKKHGYI